MQAFIAHLRFSICCIHDSVSGGLFSRTSSNNLNSLIYSLYPYVVPTSLLNEENDASFTEVKACQIHDIHTIRLAVIKYGR